MNLLIAATAQLIVLASTRALQAIWLDSKSSSRSCLSDELLRTILPEFEPIGPSLKSGCRQRSESPARLGAGDRLRRRGRRPVDRPTSTPTPSASPTPTPFRDEFVRPAHDVAHVAPAVLAGNEFAIGSAGHRLRHADRA